MSLLTALTRGLRAAPQLAWQVSAVPAQVLATNGTKDRIGLPFLAAVTGTAALGVVDWPVALLVAGGYLLARQQPTAPPPDEHVAQPPPDRPTNGARQHQSPTPAAPPTRTADAATAPPAPTPPAPDTVGVPTTPAPPAPDPPTVPTASVPSVPSGASTGREGAATSHAASASAADRKRRPPVTGDQPQRTPATPPADPPVTRAAGQAHERAARDDDGEPWVGYDQMTVPQVLKRLDERGVDLAAVASYERAHRNRKMVLAAVSQRRGATTRQRSALSASPRRSTGTQPRSAQPL